MLSSISSVSRSLPRVSKARDWWFLTVGPHVGSPIGRISGSSGAGLGLRSAALTRARTSTSRHQTSTCHVSCTPEIPPEMPPRCRRNVRFICSRIAAAVTSRGRVDRLAARGHTPVRAKVGGRQRGFEASDTYLLRWVRERNRDSSSVPHPSAQLFLPSTRRCTTTVH